MSPRAALSDPRLPRSWIGRCRAHRLMTRGFMLRVEGVSDEPAVLGRSMGRPQGERSLRHAGRSGPAPRPSSAEERDARSDSPDRRSQADDLRDPGRVCGRQDPRTPRRGSSPSASTSTSASTTRRPTRSARCGLGFGTRLRVPRWTARAGFGLPYGLSQPISDGRGSHAPVALVVPLLHEVGPSRSCHAMLILLAFVVWAE